MPRNANWIVSRGVSAGGALSALLYEWEFGIVPFGRMKGLPAFDAFDPSAAKNILFGNEITNACQFTDFSAGQSSGDASATIDSDLQTVVKLLNPLYFITHGCVGCANYW